MSNDILNIFNDFWTEFTIHRYLKTTTYESYASDFETASTSKYRNFLQGFVLTSTTLLYFYVALDWCISKLQGRVIGKIRSDCRFKASSFWFAVHKAKNTSFYIFKKLWPIKSHFRLTDSTLEIASIHSE